MASYYDVVLGMIPLTLLGVSGGLHVGGFTTTAAVTIGGLLAVGLVGHALFVRSPVHGNAAAGTEHTTVEASTVGSGNVNGPNPGSQ